MPARNPSATARRLRQLLPMIPDLAIILGSGFAGVAKKITRGAGIPYHRLPGFPRPGVPGHAGRVVSGLMGQTPVLLLCGRVHYYEGYSMDEVAFPVRVLAELGVRSVLLTNAAGGIHPRLRAGDFMAVTDHINFMGVNPLRPLRPGTPAFVDLSRVYDAELTSALLMAARQTKLRLKRGVYLAVSGPTYETPAEIRAFARLGADAVGMSTVPEAIAARQHGMRVAALSCITNLAAGRSGAPISHEEVLGQARRCEEQAGRLIFQFAHQLGRENIT
ncbi:MAG TPA: purine-nucleoside phosphorylase [Verrucomicrobiae bacterium]|nr:purine-nucleoside phosphorylase [Verrucomicrobiae bacterium]